ncbi:MAG TPA: hypothetical protein VEV86_16150 [Vicinamibacterales bacterium]|jgi:hypothetical protein|nr:hypothetical protein [Vicinamibacterales bacterium]
MRQSSASALLCIVVSLSSMLAIAGCQTQTTPGAASATPAAPAEASTMETDVAHLKDIVPAQSHTMIDVGYHMSNLWFAAQKGNWDFAAFEVDETRNRIRWTLRLSTTRKLPDGSVLDMKPLFDGIDKSVLTPLKEAVATKDLKVFVPAYRAMLEACYQCHKAAGKPYLRPMIPSAPPQTIINYDPKADWPQ